MGAEALRSNYSVVWAPQPGPQVSLLECPVFEVFYGGARGGGKTDGMLGEWVQHAQMYGEDAIGVFFRRKLTQLDEAIARSHQIYGPLGAHWQAVKNQWVFPNGARLKFRYIERDGDAENYQGHNYTRVYIEELTNFPDPKPVHKLRATLRSASGVPCRFRATGNPGGPGHQWVKARYIDPAPNGFKVLKDTDEQTGLYLDRVFIPAKVRDNKLLTEHDPHYVMRLKQSGSEALVRAWLDGDWDVIEGAYFDNWRSDKHVIAPCALPEHWTRFRSMDWGSARPFSVGWYAVATEDYETPSGAIIPKNCMVKYREWYGAKEPNVGLKLTAEEVGQGIASREPDEKVHYGVLDPAAFAQDGGPSLAERINQQLRQAKFRRADNKRVGTLGAMGGWDQLRRRLDGEDGTPMIMFFNTCRDSIRTIPALQHDENRPEDVDTEGEDHAGDETRYACMSRPYAKPAPKPKESIKRMPTFDELIKEVGDRRKVF